MTIRGICSFECDMFLLGLANDIMHRCDMYTSTKASDNKGQSEQQKVKTQVMVPEYSKKRERGELR